MAEEIGTMDHELDENKRRGGSGRYACKEALKRLGELRKICRRSMGGTDSRKGVRWRTGPAQLMVIDATCS